MNKIEISISELLAQISDSAGELNNLADKATKKIVEIERPLVETGVGIEVWVDGRLAGQFKSLGFVKSNGSWGLVVKEHDDKIVALLAAPRETRIAAIPLIIWLLKEIQQKLEQELENLNNEMN